MSNVNNNVYIYEIPYMARKDLCRILDINNDWSILGGVHMQYRTFDILEIENECRRRGSSPTDALLSRWGQQNHKIVELFVLLYQMKHLPAMESIKSHVDTKYHVLIDELHTSIGSSNRMETTDSNHTVGNPQAQGHKVQNSVKIQNVSPHTYVSNESKSSDSTQEAIAESVGALLQISYAELCSATNNWNSCNVLGKGGFGEVYKGYWKHTEVAIKKLKNTNGVKGVSDESLRELRYLNACRHDNVLPLYGYSIKGGESCLVYQLMTGGSLEERLKCSKDSLPLTWNQRLNIGQGVAKGLQFLHTVSKTPLIHGDIKSANILLDARGEPKIGDFGLARYGPDSDEFMKVSRVQGTRPYLPDDFLRGHILSVKVDVYSFGVVVLELITGLAVYHSARKYPFLRDHVVNQYKENPLNAAALEDERLLKADKSNPELCKKLVSVGIKCVEKRASDRPHMVEVLQELKSINEIYSQN